MNVPQTTQSLSQVYELSCTDTIFRRRDIGNHWILEDWESRMRVGKIAFSVAILCSSIRALNAQHRCYLLRLPRVLHETLQTWNWQCIAPGLPPGKLYVGLCSHVPPTTDESYRAYAVRNMQDCAYHMFPRTDWDCGVYKHVRLCNMLPCRIAFFMITQPDQHYFRERQ